MEKKNIANRMPKKARLATSDDEDDYYCLIPTEDNEEDTSCGYCNLNYSSVESVRKCDRIRCQECGTCYREVCVGAIYKKQSTCGEILVIIKLKAE